MKSLHKSSSESFCRRRRCRSHRCRPLCRRCCRRRRRQKKSNVMLQIDQHDAS